MLVELSIKDFAIIDNLRIQLSEGLNILTGETGAGKSIIVDALGLILGDRATNEIIRSGKEKAVIEALFKIETDDNINILKDMGIEMDDEFLLLSREVSRVGRNVCRANGKQIPLTILKEIGKNLVDIQGQHEHQSLLNKEKHIDLLDMFGGSEILSLRNQVYRSYKDYHDTKSLLKNISTKQMEQEQRKEFLKYQLEEIQKANLKLKEDEELEKEIIFLNNAEKIFNNLVEAYNLLYDNQEGIQKTVVEGLGLAIDKLEELSKLDKDTMMHLTELLEDALYKVEDVSRNLRKYIDSIEFNPERLEEMEERLNLIKRLKKKYGQTIEEIKNYENQIMNELEDYENNIYKIEHLEKELKIQENQLTKFAMKLSIKRKELASLLEQKIKQELIDLGMKKVQFKVDFNWKEDPDGININNKKLAISGKGIDSVEFLISTNPGEPAKPLAKIASGGEMSRVMLALKRILADIDKIPTLVFDEIDTGIGGRTAQSVAQKLMLISKTHQVLCITHLPQIASMADEHFYIKKEICKNSTKVVVTKLGLDERVEELARMLGGVEMTDTTLFHAKEMLKMADKLKCG
ncbi:MAG: repair protein RecN [Thermosediminibacterales bacterium]|nr:repair protein RecN [Thermosediminibacterales bacterium]